jgi:ferric-dicitrate binding protein FerR (iron transport regulator)
MCHILFDAKSHTIRELKLALGAQFRVQRDNNGLRLLVDEHRMSAQHESKHTRIIFLLRTFD